MWFPLTLTSLQEFRPINGFPVAMETIGIFSKSKHILLPWLENKQNKVMSIERLCLIGLDTDIHTGFVVLFLTVLGIHMRTWAC